MCAAGPLPSASAALLNELQPQAFVDSGFVSKYLQTNLELGRVLLANLLGLELHDLALERYVKVGDRVRLTLTLTLTLTTISSYFKVALYTIQMYR